MSGRTDTAKLIEQYDALVERAKEIVKNSPKFVWIDNEAFCKLAVSEDEATLSWPESESGYYDSYTIENRSATFPAHLLTMPDEDFAAWTRLSKKRKEEANKAAIEEHHRQREAQERDVLAQLKAKYERS